MNSPRGRKTRKSHSLIKETTSLLEDKARTVVVRDAYRAGLVKYHFSKDDVADLGGEGTFRNLFSVNASLSGGFAAGYDLNQNFSPRLRVCIRTYELGRGSGVSAADEYVIVPRDGVVPEITKEK